METRSHGCGGSTKRSVRHCARSEWCGRLTPSIIEHQWLLPERDTPMPTVLSRRSTRSDIYARPDVYDMEYEGASNQDAHFFARLIARVRPRRVLELGCGSG